MEESRAQAEAAALRRPPESVLEALPRSGLGVQRTPACAGAPSCKRPFVEAETVVAGTYVLDQAANV